MNPQPFSSLNHLTVPTATVGLLVSLDRFTPVPEGTTTATSTTKPTRQLDNRQIFLRPANDGPSRGILNNPAQCHQFVTKSIGFRPVLGALAASRCATSWPLVTSTSPPWELSASPMPEKSALTAFASVRASSSSASSAAVLAAATASK